jgi:cytoskeletal protein CcmA (bactofilin family)
MLKRKEKTQFESPERLNRLVEGTKIIGDIFSESNLRIDGEVQGNVSTAAKVVIGETGLIQGNLTCQDADIEGKLNGSLAIEGLLILRETSKIVGDIQTSKLHVEEGAVFVGSCKMNSGAPIAQINPILQAKEPDDRIY